MKNHTTALPRLKPLAACLAMSVAAASAAALFSAGTAIAAARSNSASAPAKVAAADRARHASARQYRNALRAQPQSTPATRPAGTLSVTSCADDGSPGTLRSEVGAAVSGDTIDLSQLTCSTITLTSGEIEVSVDDLTIVGPGADALTVDAGGNSRVLYHHSGSETGTGTLTVAGLTLANGRYFDDYIIAPGGCVYGGGNVTLNNATVTGCEAEGKYSIGGGIYAIGDVTLTDSTVSGNRAVGNAFKYGSSYVDDGPQPGGQGGGIYANGSITVSRSTISGNEALLENGAQKHNRGGAMFAFGPISIRDSAIVDNVASGSVDQGYGGLGGGVFSNSEDAVLEITNSTISGNSADMGGGILSIGRLDLASSTVAFNKGNENAFGGGGIVDLHDEAYGSSVVNSSIVANNTGASAYLDADFGSYGITLDGANNLIVAASGTTLPVDTLDEDPLLQPLADNGGPTRTHALGAGSPAIDAGNNARSLQFDQRGSPFERESDGRADIGAFEVQTSDVLFKDGFDG